MNGISWDMVASNAQRALLEVSFELLQVSDRVSKISVKRLLAFEFRTLSAHAVNYPKLWEEKVADQASASSAGEEERDNSIVSHYRPIGIRAVLSACLASKGAAKSALEIDRVGSAKQKQPVPPNVANDRPGEDR